MGRQEDAETKRAEPATSSLVEPTKPNKMVSPLDVEGVNLGVTTREIVDLIREGRERASASFLYRIHSLRRPSMLGGLRAST